LIEVPAAVVNPHSHAVAMPKIPVAKGQEHCPSVQIRPLGHCDRGMIESLFGMLLRADPLVPASVGNLFAGLARNRLDGISNLVIRLVTQKR
jgi:hypothetical protein